MIPEIQEPLTKDAHHIGRCPVRGCGTTLRLTVPMLGRKRKKSFGHGMYHHEAVVTEWSPAPGSSIPFYLGICCAKHKWELRWNVVNGTFSQDHKCDARCVNAKGHNCECSCGGANHGKGYDLPVFKFNAEVAA